MVAIEWIRKTTADKQFYSSTSLLVVRESKLTKLWAHLQKNAPLKSAKRYYWVLLEIQRHTMLYVGSYGWIHLAFDPGRDGSESL